jgi:2-oxoglutarate dehydrogenase E1 component
MAGQGVILGVGSIEYAPGFLGASPERLNELGVSRVMTLTSTYDHRVIQGAQSGEFLKAMEGLLRGDGDFFRDIFTSLRIPYAPLRWDVDEYVNDPDAVDKEARVLGLINSYRELGHHGRHRPAQYRPDPSRSGTTHGLSIWDRSPLPRRHAWWHRSRRTLRGHPDSARRTAAPSGWNTCTSRTSSSALHCAG